MRRNAAEAAHLRTLRRNRNREFRRDNTAGFDDDENRHTANNKRPRGSGGPLLERRRRELQQSLVDEDMFKPMIEIVDTDSRHVRYIAKARVDAPHTCSPLFVSSLSSAHPTPKKSTNTHAPTHTHNTPSPSLVLFCAFAHFYATRAHPSRTSQQHNNASHGQGRFDGGGGASSPVAGCDLRSLGRDAHTQQQDAAYLQTHLHERPSTHTAAAVVSASDRHYDTSSGLHPVVHAVLAELRLLHVYGARFAHAHVTPL
jgi:hypothetical protein